VHFSLQWKKRGTRESNVITSVTRGKKVETGGENGAGRRKKKK